MLHNIMLLVQATALTLSIFVLRFAADFADRAVLAPFRNAENTGASPSSIARSITALIRSSSAVGHSVTTRGVEGALSTSVHLFDPCIPIRSRLINRLMTLRVRPYYSSACAQERSQHTPGAWTIVTQPRRHRS